MRGYVYILECADGSYYVGSTRSVENRLAQHQGGHGSVYTRARLPVRLVYQEECESIELAYALERRIHRWSHDKRRALIEGDFARLKELARRRGRRQ